MLEKFQEFLDFIQCHDFRLVAFPAARSTVESYIEKLRRGFFVKHLRFFRPLGIEHVVAVIEKSTTLYQRLLKTASWQESPLPLNRLLYGVLCGARECVAVWHEPPGLDVYGEVSESLRDAVVLRGGVVIPVHMCGAGEVELGAHAERLLRVPRVVLKTPAVAYVLLAALDYDPLLTPGRLRDAFYAAAARGMDVAGYELKTRYYQRYYEKLSHSYVLGRVLAVKWVPVEQFLVRASRGCLRHIYAVAATYRTTGHMLVTKDFVLATMATGSAEPLYRVLKTCRDEARVEALLNSFSTKFPFEHYDPVTNKWGKKPNYLFFEMLKRMRIVISREPR